MTEQERDQQDLLILRRFQQGYTNGETTRHMKVSHGTVTKRLNRIIAADCAADTRAAAYWRRHGANV